MSSDWTAIVISGISVFIAALSLCLVFFQTTKNWYVNLVSSQRLTWAENVRQALHSYIEAYCTHQDLLPYQEYILLYLNSEHPHGNPEHIRFVRSLKAVTNHQTQTLDELIAAAQLLLNWNWREVKRESASILRSKNVPK